MTHVHVKRKPSTQTWHNTIRCINRFALPLHYYIRNTLFIWIFLSLSFVHWSDMQLKWMEPGTDSFGFISYIFLTMWVKNNSKVWSLILHFGYSILFRRLFILFRFDWFGSNFFIYFHWIQLIGKSRRKFIHFKHSGFRFGKK